MREHIDEYGPDELAYLCQEFSIDFLREFKDNIDFFKLKYQLEQKWLRAANICYIKEMNEYKKKMDAVVELVVYYYEQGYMD